MHATLPALPSPAPLPASLGVLALLLRLGGNLLALGRRRRLCILTYHRVLAQPDPLLGGEIDLASFRWQMQLLAKGFTVLPLAEALQRLQQDSLPPRAVSITFDDGYRSVHTLALPVLQQLGLPATVFATTGFVEHGSMWNDRILHAVRRLPADAHDWQALGLPQELLPSAPDLRHDPDARTHLATLLDAHVKYLPPVERQRVIEALERHAGPVGQAEQAAQADQADQDLMLDRDMLLALAQAGVEIGGHTTSHPILSRLDDAQARHEISDNKAALEAILGRRLRLFAYPNGKPGLDYDQRHVAMVRSAGYEAAFTTAGGSAGPEHDCYQIPRGRPWDRRPLMFGLRLLRWLARPGA
ncbi:polysaccharide deacetylase family protein [Herbaspirillum seropedicae]|uniref:polysaccharide deacetylase family protein n=1 Tax=Herbaspirillum seropedicae TaxID=964 RepID=UPI003FCE3D9F